MKKQDADHHDKLARHFLKKARARIKSGECRAAFEDLLTAEASMYRTPSSGAYGKTWDSARRLEKSFAKKCVLPTPHSSWR